MMIEIIEGRDSDIPALRKMLYETWHENFDNTLGENVVEKICDGTYSNEKLKQQIAYESLTFLVALDARRSIKKIIGHGLASIKEDDGKRCLFINRLYVHPKMQRRGAGKALYQALVDAYDGYDEIQLEVIENNPKARAFYEQLGFSVISTMNECLGEANVPSLKMRLVAKG